MNRDAAPLNAAVPSYVYSRSEKLRLIWSCAGQRLRAATHLIAGPFAGEFGYELMQWQGYVRARRRHYEQTHVITYPGRDYLYEQCHIYHHDILLPKAGYGYGLLDPDTARNMAQAKAATLGLKDYDIFSTALLCTQYHKRLFWRQEFRRFEEPPLCSQMQSVAFHFRAVRKEGPDQVKNYPPTLADELAERCLARGLSAMCVGHPEYAYCAKGCADHRSIDLRQTVAAICSAHLAAGENSGPMHLANLCGKPTVLWAHDQWRIDYSLRWNPFRVPIYVAANNTHQPPPALLCQAIVDALKDLEARTDGFAKPAYSLEAQPIAYY